MAKEYVTPGSPLDVDELDRKAERGRFAKDYARRMTSDGKKPWIGGSRLSVGAK